MDRGDFRTFPGHRGFLKVRRAGSKNRPTRRTGLRFVDDTVPVAERVEIDVTEDGVSVAAPLYFSRLASSVS
jgi:hypothetical protein